MITKDEQEIIDAMEMVNMLKLVFAFLLGMAIGGSLMGAMYKDKVNTYEGDIAKYNKVINHG